LIAPNPDRDDFAVRLQDVDMVMRHPFVFVHGCGFGLAILLARSTIRAFRVEKKFLLGMEQTVS
jgi:hypothetical protein